MSKTVKQVLSEAADHIEKVGHYKGHFFNYVDVQTPKAELPCCALGAIRIVSGYESALDEENYGSLKADLYVDADAVLRNHLGVAGVPCWNDAPGRTQAEVVAALRAAAEKADS